jgi:hypothetical protein
MTFTDKITCKHCGLTVRRKRFDQHYCSKHCRDSASVKRLRARSAYIKELETAPIIAPVGGHREALTRPQKRTTKTRGYGWKKGRVSPALKAKIWALETWNYPPLSYPPKPVEDETVAVGIEEAAHP